MRKLLLTALLLCLAANTPAKTPDQLREAFIDRMVEKDGFDRDEVRRILYQAQHRRPILETMSRPAEKRLNWTAYRGIFVTPSRVSGGVNFWKRNVATLERAERDFGVPPQIIVAILGVETRYGANTGGHRVLDALHTLGFHYPRRGKFFREQLRHFLLFSREEQVPPTTPTGSYAGAMGVPQFMPDSFRDYAIDYDGDGRRDIWLNDIDVIGSVANYFVEKGGWRRGEAVTAAAGGVGSKHEDLIAAGAKPSLSLESLRAAGLTFETSLPTGDKASLFDLETDDGTEYWVGFNNFYAIMRYNPRTKYAMAVYQLSKAIEEQYHVTTANAD